MADTTDDERTEPVYRIKDWAELYEPPDRVQRGRGPLKYAMLRVHGHKTGTPYRRLVKKIAKTGAMAAFGLFAKLLELAADEPKERRDGTIHDYSGAPATLAMIAEETLFPLAQVTKAMGHLVTVGWVEALGARGRAEMRAAAPKSAPNRREVNETETEVKSRKDNRREVGQTANGVSGDFSGELVSDSDSVFGIKVGSTSESIRVALFNGLCKTFGVRDSRERNTAGRQARADVTTFLTAASHAIESRPFDEALAVAREVEAMAQSKAEVRGNRKAMFVKAFKDRFGWTKK